MAIRLINGAEFLHIPKTGGYWVETVLAKSNLISKKIGPRHSNFEQTQSNSSLSGQEHLKEMIRLAHNRVSKYFSPHTPLDSNFKFCFVRNPLTWYESCWKYMKGLGLNRWDTKNGSDHQFPNNILNDIEGDTFNEFITNIIQRRPGIASEIMFSYAKPGISFIGKTENIKADLAYILNALGLRYNSEIITSTPKVNVSKKSNLDVAWDPKLKLIITKLELPALLHFGYLSETEKLELGIDINIPTHEALLTSKLV